MNFAARATCAPGRSGRPRRAVQAVPDGDAHQLVACGVVLDLVDAVAVAVVRAQHRRVLVGQPAPAPAPARCWPAARARGPPARPSRRPRGAGPRAARRCVVMSRRQSGGTWLVTSCVLGISHSLRAQRVGLRHGSRRTGRTARWCARRRCTRARPRLALPRLRSPGLRSPRPGRSRGRPGDGGGGVPRGPAVAVGRLAVRGVDGIDGAFVGERLQVAVDSGQPDSRAVGAQRRVDVLRAAEPTGAASAERTARLAWCARCRIVTPPSLAVIVPNNGSPGVRPGRPKSGVLAPAGRRRPGCGRRRRRRCADRRPVLRGAGRRRPGRPPRPRVRVRPVAGDARGGVRGVAQRVVVRGHSPAPTRSISPGSRSSRRRTGRARARSSDSVGSTISVPATGNDIVGAWKP